ACRDGADGVRRDTLPGTARQTTFTGMEGRAADPRAETRGRIHSDTEGGMNKAELADALAERTNIPRKDSRAAVEALFDPESGLIAQALQRGEKVSLTGFGTFEVRE